jgi:hypothetical protein
MAYASEVEMSAPVAKLQGKAAGINLQDSTNKNLEEVVIVGYSEEENSGKYRKNPSSSKPQRNCIFLSKSSYRQRRKCIV